MLNRWWRRVGIIAVGLALAVVLLAAIYLLVRPVALLLSAVVLAAAMEAPVSWLERRMARPVAILILYGLIALALGAIGWFLFEQLLSGADSLLSTYPIAIDRAKALLERWDPSISARVVTVVDSAIEAQAGVIAELPAKVAVSVAELVLVVVMSIYWLLAAESLLSFMLSLFPPGWREQTNQIFREMATTMGGFVRANVIDATIVGVIVGVGLVLLGVPFAIALAIVAAIGELIPLAGPYLAAIPILAVALLSDPFDAIATLALLIGVKQLEAYLILPHLTNREAAIPPLLVIFSLIAGATVGGLLGVIIAVPIAGALRVLVVRAIAPAIQRRTVGAVIGAEAAGAETPKTAV